MRDEEEERRGAHWVAAHNERNQIIILLFHPFPYIARSSLKTLATCHLLIGS